MSATTCIIIVLVCWNVGISFNLIEHIMETREHLHKLFEFLIDVMDIIRDMKNGR